MADWKAESTVAMRVNAGPELVVALAMFWIFVFPLGTYGNFGSYLNILSLTFLFGLRYGITWTAQWIVPLILMGLLLLIEAVSFGVGWQTREYVFPVAWLILLVRLPVLDALTVVRLFAALCAALILLDFFVLYIGFFPEFGRGVREIVYIRGMRIYVEHFWRHVGVLGNPNQSAFLYGIYLVTMAFLVSRAAGTLRKLEKYVILCGGAVAAFLLTVSYSRTNLIAAAVVVVYASLRGKPGRLRYFVFVGAASALLSWFGGFERIAGRFASLSSGEKRLEHWTGLLGEMTLDDVLVGSPLAASFTDSDYLYFLLRYGLMGLLLVMWVVGSLYACARSRGLVGELFGQVVVYAAIAGTAMGVFASPNIGALIFYLGAVVLASRDRVADGAQRPAIGGGEPAMQPLMSR